VKARVTGCGADGWTDSEGKFSVSGRLRAGGYLSCTLQVSLPGCEVQNVPLTAPAGSVRLGAIVLKPVVKGAAGGTVSFLSMSAPPEARKVKQRAQENVRKGEWREAERNLEAALKIYADDPEAWLGLGIVHRRLGDMAKARAAFEKAIALDRQFVPPLIEMAVLALQGKEWRAAIEFAERALAVDPNSFPDARLYLATAYLNIGDYAAAEHEARSILALAADRFPKAHHILGVALAKQGRVPEGIAELESFLVKAPRGPDADLVRQHMRLLKGK
jgi:tetratricopeptide (TPR) repeat protein